MIARFYHLTTNLVAASALMGLAGCTSGLESAARQELKANPAAGTQVAAAQSLVLDPPTEPGPIVPGSESHAPIPTFRATVLASADTPPNAGDAVAVMTARQDEALKTPAMPANGDTNGLTTLADADAQSSTDDLPPGVDVAQTIVPTQRPDAALAYAAPATASTAALDVQFDTSAPAVVEAPTTQGPTVINGLIKKYAAYYEVPEALVHRVVHRESRYNPAAFNNGHYGLMQIKYATAKSMGYDGPANGLFDAESNLKYAVKYLRGAWLVADKSSDNAVRLYARGYYYDAKRRGMLSVFN